MRTVVLILSLFFRFLEFMVIIECLMSWIPPAQNTRFYYLITKFNYPFLEPIRRFLRRFMPSGFMIDISPIILFALIVLVQRLLTMAL